MKVISYTTVEKFLEENEHILLEKEAVSQLILFNAMANRNSETSESLIFGKVTDENQHLLLIFANVLPYNLVIHTLTSNVIPEAIAALADFIIQNNIFMLWTHYF